jgi:hypothetical protein
MFAGQFKSSRRELPDSLQQPFRSSDVIPLRGLKAIHVVDPHPIEHLVQ